MAAENGLPDEDDDSDEGGPPHSFFVAVSARCAFLKRVTTSVIESRRKTVNVGL